MDPKARGAPGERLSSGRESPGPKRGRKEDPALRPSDPTPERARGPRAGVGLLAILVTLAAIALLAGLAIPFWFGRHEITLDNAALLLARDLRAVQNRAAFLGEPAWVSFHPHGWEATDESGAVISRYGGQERFLRRLDADGVFEGVTLQEIRFGDDRALSFGPHGEALESGSIEVHFRGQHRLVRMRAPDGEVLIEGLARGVAAEGL